MNHRVTLRLLALLEKWPVKAIGSVRVDQALWVREKMKEIQDSVIGSVFRQSTLGYSAAKWAWRAWNVANPVYWGRQAIYTGGREAAVRYLLTSLVTYVGEEAVIAYSGQPGDHTDAQESLRTEEED